MFLNIRQKDTHSISTKNVNSDKNVSEMHVPVFTHNIVWNDINYFVFYRILSIWDSPLNISVYYSFFFV